MKPCPFCGKIEHLEVVDSKEGVAKVVKCWACGTIGPYGASNESFAIELWNERAKLFSYTVSGARSGLSAQVNK